MRETNWKVTNKLHFVFHAPRAVVQRLGWVLLLRECAHSTYVYFHAECGDCNALRMPLYPPLGRSPTRKLVARQALLVSY